jgi:hypothetical protein
MACSLTSYRLHFAFLLSNSTRQYSTVPNLGASGAKPKLYMFPTTVGRPTCWKQAPTAHHPVFARHGDLETTAHLSQRHLQAVTHPLDSLALSGIKNVSRALSEKTQE